MPNQHLDRHIYIEGGPSVRELSLPLDMETMAFYIDEVIRKDILMKRYLEVIPCKME